MVLIDNRLIGTLITQRTGDRWSDEVGLALTCPTTRHALPSAIEIEEVRDNLYKQVSKDCVPDIWADVPKSMIQESDKEASKVILEPKVDA